MSNLSDKITQLEKQLETQDRKLQAKLRNTFIIYAVLIIAALIYTSWAVAKMQELTSPKAIGEQLRAYLNQEVPANRDILANRIKVFSTDYAKEAATTVNAMLPEVEKNIINVLDGLTGYVTNAVLEEIMPQFVAFIREDAPRLKEQYKELQDPDVAKGIVAIMLEVMSSEADDFLNDKMVDALNDLELKLKAMKNPASALTRQQDAQRRALVYWSYLAQKSETGSSPYYDMLMQVKQKFEIYFGPDVDEDTIIIDEEDEDRVIEY